ncbi:hypothetical protein HHK36_021304 [Tetracentron sinense]|uniref:Uncharacterized protein n=1 Tax=Tetracentron sinense TaxID=13715 RepID=A0A835D6Y4_TETSI|nr:hypothetical protein HHK36_021304 [Tetracentron sinense]
MEKPSWICTLLTQASLCLALFIAFNLGRPQKSIYYNSRGRHLDIYFLSVRGGSRPLKQQIHLLSQMEKVAKTYKAEFIVNISELGEDDPLMLNGTSHLSLLKIPWYTTRALKGLGRGYFLKQMPILHGQTLDIIGLDTRSLQDYLCSGQSNGAGNDQLHWLTKTLELTDSCWRIVVGFHPLEACEEHMKTKSSFEPLRSIFLKFGVNAYLSKQGFTDNYPHKGSVAYIGSPGSTDKETYHAPVNGRPVVTNEMCNGFLLHRVTPLEIVGIQFFRYDLDIYLQGLNLVELLNDLMA